jgi:hypothetical protein
MLTQSSFHPNFHAVEEVEPGAAGKLVAEAVSGDVSAAFAFARHAFHSTRKFP